MFNEQEYMKQWQQKHKTQLKEYNKQWHLNNLDKARQYEIYRNSKNILFKGKRTNTGQLPRTGYCSLCDNNIYDGTCKRTSIHHFAQYHDDDPLKDTIELCNSCHAYETNNNI